MNDYLHLLGLLAPVFLLILLGICIRRGGLLSESADQSILRIVVNVFYPSLIFRSVMAADSLGDVSKLIIPPIVGFLVVAMGAGIAWIAARAIGLRRGAGLRTFCFSVSILNYGYIPIPIISDLYGENELAVLFIFNAGVEFGIWTLGIAMLSGGSWKNGLSKTINSSAIVLIVALLIKFTGLAPYIPSFVHVVIHNLANCAIPIGLIIIGATLNGFIDSKESPFEIKTSASSVFLRLMFIPLLMLIFTRLLPFPLELKRVLVIQAAMPAGILPIVLAKHYDGQPIVAVRIVIATTLVGVLTIPFVINFGNWFILGQ
ncbi:AEC family transporter [Puniceicoccaceae bacterium K14]|nr:AEC family transporter [Puniceicoccaceae bacterium K14]